MAQEALETEMEQLMRMRRERWQLVQQNTLLKPVPPPNPKPGQSKEDAEGHGAAETAAGD